MDNGISLMSLSLCFSIYIQETGVDWKEISDNQGLIFSEHLVCKCPAQ